MSITITHGDGVVGLDTIKQSSVDLVLVDLPYGQTNFEWDVKIDLANMWEKLKKCCKKNTLYIFFATTRFGFDIIESNKLWFKYDLVWEKSNNVGYLNAAVMPMRNHEMIYLFGDNKNDDLDLVLNMELRAYAKRLFEYMNLGGMAIRKKMGNRTIEHFGCYRTTQFGIPTAPNYKKMCDLFELNDLEYLMKYEDMKTLFEKESNKKTYNKVAGEKCPNSILKFANPKKSLHPTQKPTKLLEWLITTYTNDGATVLDFTMGSGSTAIACLNTGRSFIGFELDKTIFETAKNRIDNHIIGED